MDTSNNNFYHTFLPFIFVWIMPFIISWVVNEYSLYSCMITIYIILSTNIFVVKRMYDRCPSSNMEIGSLLLRDWEEFQQGIITNNKYNNIKWQHFPSFVIAIIIYMYICTYHLTHSFCNGDHATRTRSVYRSKFHWLLLSLPYHAFALHDCSYFLCI